MADNNNHLIRVTATIFGLQPIDMPTHKQTLYKQNKTDIILKLNFKLKENKTYQVNN